MSGALDFLSQGTSPTAFSGFTQSSSQLPAWYTDYTAQILNKAAQYANEPYQPYQGPRIAGQSAQTQDAYGAISGLPQAAASGTQAAQNLVQQGAALNNPTGAAQPYLNSAANPTYNTVQSYMNPYNRNVTDEIAAAGNRNLTENTLPALQNSFIGAGNITGGSTREADLAERAARDQNLATSAAQGQALQSGYGQSLNAAQAGANTQAGLANTAGALNTAGANTAINAGGALSGVNSQGTNSSLASIGAENTLGQQNQGYTQSNLNLAYQDFLNQQQDPLKKAGAMQGALSGINVPTANTSYNYGNATGTTATPSVLSGVSSTLSGLGAATTPSSQNPFSTYGQPV